MDSWNAPKSGKLGITRGQCQRDCATPLRCNGQARLSIELTSQNQFLTASGIASILAAIMKQRSNLAPLPGTRAVVRAITVLKTLGRSTDAYGISELGEETGLSKATVFRLLGALEGEGMVARNGETGTYRLGPELINLGASALSATDLHAAAHHELVELTRRTGETSTLEVLFGTDVVILDEVKGRFLLGSTPEIGRRWAAHATSTGKLLLALGPGVHTLARLPRLAHRTIVSRSALERELRRISKLRYAIAVDELEPGLVAMAAPITNHDGAVVAAISVNGPGSRLTASRRRQFLSPLCKAAATISRRLGAPPETLHGATPARHARSTNSTD